MDTTKLPTTWDLSLILKNNTNEVFEQQKQELIQRASEFANKWKDRTDYLENPEILKEALDDYENWEKNFGALGNIGYYYELRYYTDQLDPQIKSRFNQIEELSSNLINIIQFFNLNIGKIPQEKQTQFLNYSPLSPYKHFLERTFAESKYLLSEAEEKIMNLKSIPAHSNWVKMTQGFLSQEEVEVTNEEGQKVKMPYYQILSLLSSQKKTVRDEAAAAFNQILERHVDVAEAEINAILTDKKINDQIRGVPRPDLMRLLADDVEPEIVDTLVQAVTEKFDIAQRFYRLKAKLLGQERLLYHERNVDYGKLQNHFPFPQAVELVDKVLTELDSKFGEIFQQFAQNGQFDVYPKKGKRGGAFCAHNLLIQPTYIMLNHSDKLADVLTIAHETGHGINNELMRTEQNALNFDTPLSTAEVASTFMEDFVLEEILSQSDEEERLAIMMMKLNDDIGSIFRQVAGFNFETELHKTLREKGYLPKEEIGQIFQKHMASYMGEAVEQSPGSENWWVYWSHIRNFFYVYSYASGLLISKSLQSKVKQDHQFIQQIKVFLSAGSSKSPKDIFANLGIDITQKDFWLQGLLEIDKLLNETEVLAKKLGKV